MLDNVFARTRSFSSTLALSAVLLGTALINSSWAMEPQDDQDPHAGALILPRIEEQPSSGPLSFKFKKPSELPTPLGLPVEIFLPILRNKALSPQNYLSTHFSDYFIDKNFRFVSKDWKTAIDLNEHQAIESLLNKNVVYVTHGNYSCPSVKYKLSNTEHLNEIFNGDGATLFKLSQNKRNICNYSFLPSHNFLSVWGEFARFKLNKDKVETITPIKISLLAPCEYRVHLGATKHALEVVEEKDKITVKTGKNTVTTLQEAPYQLTGNRRGVPKGWEIFVSYDITVESGGKMSFGLFDESNNICYRNEDGEDYLILETGHHKGVFKRTVPDLHNGLYSCCLVFCNAHLAPENNMDSAPTNFTIHNMKMKVKEPGSSL
jgi:hypothetical protein